MFRTVMDSLGKNENWKSERDGFLVINIKF